MTKTDHQADRNMGKCELSATPGQNGKVCKTFIRRFNSDPRLHLESTNQPFNGENSLPGNSPEKTNKHRSAQDGPSLGRTARQNGPTPAGQWRRIANPKEAGDMPGVYVLICAGRAVYVGQSLRLSERVRGHRWRFEADGVRTARAFYPGAYVKVRGSRRFGDWLMVEARLIRRLMPSENVRNFVRALGPDPTPIQEDGSISIDLSGLSLAAQREERIEPVVLDPKPEGWGLRPCGCGRVHELSYLNPRADCACGWWLELVTPYPKPQTAGGIR